MTKTLSLADVLAEAFRLVERDKPAEARKIARRIEKQTPSLPGLAYLLGSVAAAEREDAKAARHFTRALDETPDALAPLVAMARCQARQGRDRDAETFYRRAIAAAQDPMTKRELATLLVKRAATLAPADAIATYAQIVELDPESATAAFMLAEARNRAGEIEGAIAMYRRAAALDPADRLGARIMLARLGADAAPDKAPDAFVRTLFDQYADGFDESLVGKLNYRAPELLADAILRTLGAGPFDIYDAGCGTGLMGAALKPVARRLVGSDLSPKMIAQARLRGIYDALTAGDFVAELAAAKSAYDLVTAADVLVYNGDLAPAFAAVATALKPGGGFAFTVERRAGEGWSLGESGRYAHPRAYLVRLAEAHGFRVVAVDEASTREDRGAPVPGLVCMLIKTGPLQ
jgi:predicted TPR repeat methyltransferase